MMFDLELSSIVAIFAGIAALIAYINKRSKRQIKTSSKPFVLKKMPGSSESTAQGSDLEEWNFPQPTYETSAPPSRGSNPESPPPIFAPTTLTPAFASPLYSGQSYQEIAPQQAEAPRHTPKGGRAAHSRLGTHADLRESIVTMTILGPCRAMAPFQERE